MKTASRIWFLLAAFLVTAGVVYGATSQEFAGASMLVVAAVVFFFLGVVARGLARAEALRESDQEATQVEEIHVGPTIWPFAFSVAAFFIALGLIVTRWLLVVGVGLFGLAAAGWLRETTRRHHEIESH